MAELALLIRQTQPHFLSRGVTVPRPADLLVFFYSILPAANPIPLLLEEKDSYCYEEHNNDDKTGERGEPIHAKADFVVTCRMQIKRCAM